MTLKTELAELLALSDVAKPGKWDHGIAGTCTLVSFDGSDITGIAHFQSHTNKALAISAVNFFRTHGPALLAAVEDGERVNFLERAGDPYICDLVLAVHYGATAREVIDDARASENKTP